ILSCLRTPKFLLLRLASMCPSTAAKRMRRASVPARQALPRSAFLPRRHPVGTSDRLGGQQAHLAHIGPDGLAGDRGLGPVAAMGIRQHRARGSDEKQHQQRGLHQALPFLWENGQQLRAHAPHGIGGADSSMVAGKPGSAAGSSPAQSACAWTICSRWSTIHCSLSASVVNRCSKFWYSRFSLSVIAVSVSCLYSAALSRYCLDVNMEVLPSVRGCKRVARPSCGPACVCSFRQRLGDPPLTSSPATTCANRWRIRGRAYLKRFRTLSCSGPRFEFSSTIHVDKSFGP